MEWVVIRTQRFSEPRWIISAKRRRPTGSIPKWSHHHYHHILPDEGSSINTTSGSPMKATATETRRLLPPLQSEILFPWCASSSNSWMYELITFSISDWKGVIH